MADKNDDKPEAKDDAVVGEVETISTGDPSPSTESAPAPAPSSKKSKKTVTLVAGDTPATIAKEHLGNGGRARDVVLANRGATWAAGSKIVLPD